eukprot:TRINITY_DN2320_c0_g1_i4.p1 TRINITY_DN2320_c0_g1~~TRINITY_DN2320_c0_g1_i4.p1  ORF type:complete len:1256 (+),score=103.54 TRINITY_DN2320_c0_g1_i4:2501-6268(+)
MQGICISTFNKGAFLLQQHVDLTLRQVAFLSGPTPVTAHGLGTMAYCETSCSLQFSSIYVDLRPPNWTNVFSFVEVVSKSSTASKIQFNDWTVVPTSFQSKNSSIFIFRDNQAIDIEGVPFEHTSTAKDLPVIDLNSGNFIVSNCNATSADKGSFVASRYIERGNPGGTIRNITFVGYEKIFGPQDTEFLDYYLTNVTINRPMSIGIRHADQSNLFFTSIYFTGPVTNNSLDDTYWDIDVSSTSRGSTYIVDCHGIYRARLRWRTVITGSDLADISWLPSGGDQRNPEIRNSRIGTMRDLEKIRIVENSEFGPSSLPFFSRCGGEDQHSIFVDGCNFTDYTSSVFDINCPHDFSLTIRRSTFQNITAVDGAIKIRSTNLNLHSSAFRHTSTTAISARSSYLTITNTSFYNSGRNTSSGGALYFSNGYLNIRNSNFTRNLGLRGGAVLIDFSRSLSPGITNATFIDCSFIDNMSQGPGGAILFNDDEPSFRASAVTALKNCTFRNNTSHQSGGAAHFGTIIGDFRSITGENNVFEQNHAPWGRDFSSYPFRFQAYGIVDSIEFERMAVQAASPFMIEARLYDFFKHQVEGYLASAFSFLITSPSTVGGTTTVGFNSTGVAKLSSILLFSRPGQVDVLELASSGLGITLPSQAFEVDVRNCSPGFRLVTTAGSGFACTPCGTSEYTLGGNPDRCLQCPLQLFENPQCAEFGDSTHSEALSVKEGFWVTRFPTETSRIARCGWDSEPSVCCRSSCEPVSNYSVECIPMCPDESYSNHTGCMNGYEGPLCSRCICNSDVCYARSGGACHKCTSNSTFWAIAISLICAIVIGVVLIPNESARWMILAEIPLCLLMFIFGSAERWVFQVLALAVLVQVLSSEAPHSGFGKMLLFLAQGVAFIFEDSWSAFKPLKVVFDRIDFVPSARCISPTLFQSDVSSMAASLLIPLFLVAIFLVLGLIRTLSTNLRASFLEQVRRCPCVRPQSTDQSDDNSPLMSHLGSESESESEIPIDASEASPPTSFVAHWLNSVGSQIIFVLLGSYMEVNSVIFSSLPLACVESVVKEDWWLKSQPWISCDRQVAPYSGIFAVACIFFLCYTIGIPCLFAFLLAWSKRAKQAQYHWVGVLNENYREGLRFFELAWMLRRAALGAAFSLLVREQYWTSRALVVHANLGFAILIDWLAQPFKTKLENSMNLIMLLCLQLSAGVTSAAAFDDNNLTYGIPIYVSLALCCALFITLLGLIVGAPIRKRLCTSRESNNE